MILNCLTYNSQTHFYKDSELYNYDLSGLDFIFLQRCRQELKDHIETTTGLKGYLSNDIGFCVLTNLIVDVTDVGNEFQTVRYDNYSFVNFMSPMGDAIEREQYFETILSLKADMYVGDTHGYIGKALHDSNYRADNILPNFSKDYTTGKLTYIIIDTARFSISNEVAEPKYVQGPRHFPVKFKLNKL